MCIFLCCLFSTRSNDIQCSASKNSDWQKLWPQVSVVLLQLQVLHSIWCSSSFSIRTFFLINTLILGGSSVHNSAAHRGIARVCALVSCALIQVGLLQLTVKLLALSVANDVSLELDSQDRLNISVTGAPFLHCFVF